MKKDFAKWKLFVVAFAVFLMVGANAVHAQPMLVMQPAFSGMSFYVHQPYGIPTNWFTTFDGYPVWKGTDGVWFYGSYSGANLIQTSYVVGAVVPSAIGIHPFVAQTAVAAASPPATAQAGVVAAIPVATAAPAGVVVSSPSPGIVAPTAVVPYLGVGLNPRFIVLGSWRGSVDRIGILAQPSIPVAWKGMWPKMVYAWTGSQWYQLVAREGERPGDVLRNNLYLLTRLVHQNGNAQWQAPSVEFLINQTAVWGYIWMGQVGPNPQWVY